MRSLRNISNVEATIKEPVVANNATASTVAFIAPGPPNPPITQVSVSSLLLSWVYFLHLPSSPLSPFFQLVPFPAAHPLPLYWQPPSLPLPSLPPRVNCQLSASPYDL